MTGTRSVRVPRRSVTIVPHGSVRLATPSVPAPSVSPQAVVPPGPYQDATTWW